MAETFKNIPEIFEVDNGSALKLRDETLGTFRDLGVSDLVNVIKSNPKLQAKELSSFHYVMGVDTSSSASIAAYMNSLTYSMEDSSGWFSKPTWKMTSGTFCCYNAFARMDIRVEVHIPGGVKTSAVYPDGQSVPATADLWQEAYLSSVLRCIWDQDLSYTGLRKMDPLSNSSLEKKFIEAAKALFHQGINLGCEEEYQVPSIVNNYLARGVLKYFVDTQRPLLAVEFFREFVADEPEVSALLAEAYLRADEDVKAVKILHKALKACPNSLALLHVQAQFLRSKSENDLASKISKFAVDHSPSEFVGWNSLTQIAIDVNDFSTALVCLNASPMFVFSDRENIPISPQPLRVHVPVKENIPDADYLDAEPDFYLNNPANIDPVLQRLQSPNLKGTLRRSYLLLTQICKFVGWDDLLGIRSNVFVMEEEYFQLRTVTEKQRKTLRMEPFTPIDAPAIKELPEPAAKEFESPLSSKKSEDSPIPPAPLDKSLNTSGEKVSAADVSIAQSNSVDRPSLPAIRTGFARFQDEASNFMPKTPKTTSTAHSRHSSKLIDKVSNKRLCERWLDSLFMLLYEDLRVYTIWKAEIQHYQVQTLDYRRTAAEWEILGFLSLRLNHKDDAIMAFVACLDQRFSLTSASQLLKIYEQQGKIKESLGVAAKLIAYQEYLYQHCIYPSLVGRHLFALIRRFGLSKIRSSLSQSSLSTANQALFVPFFKYAESMQIMGYDQ